LKDTNRSKELDSLLVSLLSDEPVVNMHVVSHSLIDVLVLLEDLLKWMMKLKSICH